MRILLTGGAGFIGSALVRELLSHGDEVLVVDKLTYAGVEASLTEVADHPRFRFLKADIADAAAMSGAFDDFQPDRVAHLAAETHVDRSIDGPAVFIQTNVVGTQVLLDQALAYWRGLSGPAREAFRFLHVSTDEVFGSLGAEGRFNEATPYDPRSPYSASKAASDHLVRAWGHTFGLPVVISNCSNNYGPRQFPEKLIPTLILKALAGEPLPIYGDGSNVRDWLHVDDHARALRLMLERAEPGRTYCVGGDAERTNLQVAAAVCAALDKLKPRPDGRPHADAITLVEDRPGHDRRYAIDSGLIRAELGWRPEASFEQGMARTVAWYLDNRDWWAPLVAARMPRRGLG
ncbi:dTDP-glucose 4,6-dehydratase [Brevundimonas naejangsanensis]|uniref:dTDP-glucose 4,6-dehydratase n=1 Tax=Brevundimonas naejangsanensis TaxID=588932 RepID=UPI0026F3612D|nr:dTDP-glucose 4,6-dehydratase [Brevundimonas naejangsanensis]